MPLKTILVHLDTEAQGQSLAQAAIAVAKTFLSHVIGLHLLPNAFISAGMSGEMISELVDTGDLRHTAVLGESQERTHLFRRTGRNRTVGQPWR